MYRVVLLVLLIAAPAGAQPYSAEQIRTAMFVGADGDGDRFQDDCEAKAPGGGFFGRLTNNPIVRSVARDRIAQTAGQAASDAIRSVDGAVVEELLGDEFSTVGLAMRSALATAVAQRAADGVLPPLPDEIRVTGEPPLARLAEVARQVRRTYRPLPEPDAPAVLEVIGDDLFRLRAWAYVKGIEWIVLRPRGDDDNFEAVVQPVAIEDETTFMTAHFAGADVRRILEDGDVQVVVVTPTAELTCNLDDRRLRRGFDPLR